MKKPFFVGDKITLVNITVNDKNHRVALNLHNGMFKSVFFNPKAPSIILDNPILDINVAHLVITDAGKNNQYFGTVLKNSIDDDLVGSFAQGLNFSDLEIRDISCVVWSIAHPATKLVEFVEYNNLKYILSLKATSNIEQGQMLIKHIDSHIA